VSESSFRDENPFAPPRAVVADLGPDHAATQAPASRGVRLGATLIDCAFFLLTLAPMMVLAYGLFPGARAQAVIPAAIACLVAFLVLTGANWSLLWRGGQTLGKRILGIRVVRSNGDRASFPRQVFVRYLLTSIVLGIPSLIAQGLAPRAADPLSWAAWTMDALFIFGASRQCLHDMIADTKVVTAASSTRATRAGARA
jgi:uncharacterized RDD family membrane protein YckC